MSRALVVSIHDVSPLTHSAVAAMLAELEQLGVDRCSLLVVPDHHHRGHFLGDENFCEWLRAQAGRGHEIVIHGYHHQRERKAGESLGRKFITRVYTADEGEFFDIGEDDAARLVSRARGEFQQLGLDPRGFIAPAWLLSDAAERTLRKLRFEYTTRIATVLDLANGTRHRSPSMVYSTRSAWRRAVSLAWNASLFRRLREKPLLRIGIHPPDFQHAKIWHQIRACAARALNDRTPMTYERWIAEARTAVAQP
jgi:uncharacterized protein